MHPWLWLYHRTPPPSFLLLLLLLLLLFFFCPPTPPHNHNHQLLALGIVVYLLNFLIFAGIYHHLSDQCQLGINSFAEAFFFSMETLATIGYGVEGPGSAYWDGCIGGLFALMVQILSGVLLDSMVIGIVFQRIGNTQREREEQEEEEERRTRRRRNDYDDDETK